MTSNHRKLAGGTGIGLAAVIVLLALSAAAPATVVVDLRFSDGSKTKVAQPGDFSIDVWAQVTGTDPALRDGLIWIYGSVQSTQINGGAVAGGAGTGITGNQAAPLFTITPFVGAPGDPQNVTADGIQDWGTPFGLGTASIKYNSALSDAEGVPGVIPVYSDAPGVIAHAIPNGTEYKVGTLTFHIDSFIQGEGVDRKSVV